MPTIESLLYSPINMDEFREFCIEGKPTGSTVPPKFEKDEDLRDMVGVFSWLNGSRVDAAHFFHTAQQDPLQLFIALVQPRNPEVERPWFRRLDFKRPRILFQPDIPGIDRQLRIDGLFGKQETFLSMGDLLAGLEPDLDLDEQFARQQGRVLAVLEQLEGDEARIEKFLAALRSDKGSESGEVFDKLKFSLRD
jgi:hypothetical protein